MSMKDIRDPWEYRVWRGMPDGALLLLFRTDGEGKVTVEHKGTEACQAGPAPVGLETH